MSYYYDICTQESCEQDSKFSRALRLKNLSSIGLILSPLLRLASVQNERKSVSKRNMDQHDFRVQQLENRLT